jgi:hypothetical protein
VQQRGVRWCARLTAHSTRMSVHLWIQFQAECQAADLINSTLTFEKTRVETFLSLFPIDRLNYVVDNCD